MNVSYPSDPSAISVTTEAGASSKVLSAPASNATASNATASNATASKARQRSTWLASLTVISFLFGGLLAMQLRAVEQVHQNREKTAEGVAQAKAQMERMQRLLAAEKTRSDALSRQINRVSTQLAAGSTLSRKTVATLTTQLKQLQAMAGLSPVRGRGVRIVLTDNPNAAQNAGGNPIVPGIVHDFDLLQVVNELRGAKAEAISLNGTRITGFTPIRCVGPTIMVNFDPATPPFTIEAIGDPDTLTAALRLPNGIVDNLKNQGGLGVRITRVDELSLPASENLPRMQIAKAP